VSDDKPPTAVELIILRNQRAIMRALTGSRYFDEPALISQGQETYEYLKAHGALEKRK